MAVTVGVEPLEEEAAAIFAGERQKLPVRLELAADPEDLEWIGTPIMRTVKELPIRLGRRSSR
jgi:hypothetical protein